MAGVDSIICRPFYEADYGAPVSRSRRLFGVDIFAAQQTQVDILTHRRKNMKKATQIRVGVLAILIATFLLTGCEGAYVTQKVTTSGTIVLKDKDAAGKVTSVEIKNDAGSEIIVEISGKGKELLGMIGKKVEVSGLQRESSGTKLIKVESYKVLD